MIYSNPCNRGLTSRLFVQSKTLQDHHSHFLNTSCKSSQHPCLPAMFRCYWILNVSAVKSCWSSDFLPQRSEHLTLPFYSAQTQQCDVHSKGNYLNLKVIPKCSYSKYFKNLQKRCFCIRYCENVEMRRRSDGHIVEY